MKYPRMFSDKLFLRIAYRYYMGVELNLNAPHTFNEKLQWLKLYDRNPEYTQMADKLEAKNYVASVIGKQYIIPTLAVYESVEQINIHVLPEQFVLKCTHDSGSVAICREKKTFDKEKAFAKLKFGLNKNYFWQNREWPYKNIKPRIIAEQYLCDDSNELRDYKFFCFDGQVKALFVATDRMSDSEETKFDFFDSNFQHLDIRNGHPNSLKPLKKPLLFEEMKYLASKLSRGIPHLRVDFYEVDGQVYFGELTFFHWSGFTPFEPKKWDEIFGQWISLPSICTWGKT